MLPKVSTRVAGEKTKTLVLQVSQEVVGLKQSRDQQEGVHVQEGVDQRHFGDVRNSLKIRNVLKTSYNEQLDLN